MILRNEDGIGLIENVVAVFILVVISAMIITGFIAGLRVYKVNMLEYKRINTVYDEIEQVDDELFSSILSEQEGKITFQYDGDVIEIDGTYIYDGEKGKIGDFVTE